MLEIVCEGRNQASFHMDRDRNILNKGNSCPQLRFYEWNSFCCTHGMFVTIEDFIDIEECKREDIEIASRPTGGGILFHQNDLAFSLFIPSSSVLYALSLENLSTLINGKVLEGLAPFLSNVYPNNLKNWNFFDTERSRFDSEKTSPLLDIGAVFSESKMGCSVKEKTDSSSCLGISKTEKQDCSLSDLKFCMGEAHLFDLVWKGKKVGGCAFRKKKKGILCQTSLFLGEIPWEKIRTCVKNPSHVDHMKSVSESISLSKEYAKKAINNSMQGVFS